MKKNKKIFLINVVLIISFLFITELFNCAIYYIKTKNVLELKNSAGLIQNFHYTIPHKFNNQEYWSRFYTKHLSKNNKKRPILFLGCSYILGIGLDEEQTLPYKIYELTDRSVYKRGVAGGGIQLALSQFETGEIQKEVPDAEYIIYLYIDYHISRLFSYQLDFLETEVNQRYKIKNGKLVKIKQPLFPYYYSLFTVKNIQEYIEAKCLIKENQNFKLFNAVMSELLAQTRKNYKDSKFVIVLYPSANNLIYGTETLPQFEIDTLKQMGFIVVNAEDLTQEPIKTNDYRIEDNDHPNEKAWDAIAKPLVQELGL